MLILSSPESHIDANCAVLLNKTQLAAWPSQEKRIRLMSVSMLKDHVYLESSNKQQYTQTLPADFHCEINP